ncbi:MAG: chemotaxis protein CheW [Desulfotalea sp.]
MHIEDDEILQGFVEESLEHLSSIENDLLTIEEGGADIDEDLVNKVFRAAHSIKGGAGFMGLTAIQEISHASENILGLIRNQTLVPTPEIVNVLLIAMDQLQAMIEDVHESNNVDITSHVNDLNNIAENKPPKQEETPATEEIDADDPAIEDPAEIETASENITSDSTEDAVDEIVITELPPIEDDYIDNTATAATSVAPVPANTAASKPKKAKTAPSDTTLRVHVSLLDSLMTSAGELVLSRNQLLQTIVAKDFRNVEAVGQRLDLITSELQEAIMLTRMQPIGNVFSKFPRVVRDLSKQLGKTIELKIIGKEVELDKTIIEAINDPLTHLVRNSVDHGIELGATRKAAGKTEDGLVVLKAYHEAGQVCIEISDDGKGLDGEALAASAVNKGLLTLEQTQVMSDKEKIYLIFMPGFSTAAEVTDVSGRGVGMDVVKTNLDKLGGNVDIISEIGQGTTISIKLPLTLAIIPCQIIDVSSERYAIPQVNLEELLRIPASQVKERIERVGDAEVVRLRGNLLPLIRLADVIGLERQFWDPESKQYMDDKRENIADRRGLSDGLSPLDNETQDNDKSPTRSVIDRRGATASALNIVVVSSGSMKYGLIVDKLQDSEEIVIKPLGVHLQHCKAYAGATIMGDGRIALILDVGNIARMADLTSLEGSQRAAEVAKAAEDEMRAHKDRQSLLVFRNSANEQFAIPLNQVERIEKIKRSDIEEMGQHRTMQYRGGSLTLIKVDDVAVVAPLADQDDLLVIVFNIANTTVGLLAIGPIDALEITVDIDEKTLQQNGIMGSTIINDHTTLLVNVFEMVQTLFPDWYEEQPIVHVDIEEDEEAPTVLIAEDSKFFRNQVKGYMTEAGYQVIEGEDGVEALQHLEDHFDDISILVTDIEMPNMNGFQLTEQIRKNPRFQGLPIIALTTLASDEDKAKGKSVGIDEYHIKLDKEKLMACVHDYMKRLH